MKRFEVRFLEEAVAFLDELDEKSREKIIYNVRKAQMSNDKELFKKLNQRHLGIQNALQKDILSFIRSLG